MTKREAWVMLFKMIFKWFLSLFGIKENDIKKLGFKLNESETWIVLMWKVLYICAFIWAIFVQVVQFLYNEPLFAGFAFGTQFIIFPCFFLLGNLKFVHPIIRKWRVASDCLMAGIQISFLALNLSLGGFLATCALISPAWVVIYYYHKVIFSTLMS